MFFKEGLHKILNSKSKVFLAFCFCFISGVAVSALLDLDQSALKIIYYIILILGFTLGVIWPNKKSLASRHPYLIVIAIIIFFSGAMRFIISLPTPSIYLGQKNIYAGQIIGEPKLSATRGEYTLKTTFGERWLVYLPAFPTYKSGVKLTIDCQPENLRLTNADSSNYQKTLAVKHISALCYQAKVIEANPSSVFNLWAQIYKLKNIISERVGILWSEPGATLVGGILYGDRRAPDKEITEQFTRVGLVHIVAVSGYNITIISNSLMLLLIFLGLHRQRAFWWAVGGIAVFVIFTGAPDSAVRAGLMSTAALFGQYLGRQSRGFNLLILIATLMILVNPLILPWSIGFQLSFAATFGLMFLGKSDSVWRTTLSATIATLPIILYHFGRLSLASITVNMLTLWIIPYLMLGSFLAIILSYVYWPIGVGLAWLTHFGLQYLLTVVQIFSRQNWASVSLGLSGFLVLIIYIVVIKYAVWQNKN